MTSNKFSCHSETCHDVVTFPDDPNTFLSCGEDGTVRYFDLRHKTKCNLPRCNEVCFNDLFFIKINLIIKYYFKMRTI